MKDDSKDYSFADGLMMLSTKGIKSKRVNLTKLRAQMLLAVVDRMADETALYPEDLQDDYCALMAWLVQQVDKRWSRFELRRENGNRQK